MGQITRTVVGEETLDIENCPCCDGEIKIRDCGYSSFNIGWAECQSCKRKWTENYAGDRWSIAKNWNKTAQTIKQKLIIINNLVAADHRLVTKAKKILKEFREYVIGSDKPK